ncbi:MAG: sigma-54-dependent Fis family transcriptional regulator [Candidatus Latescibacteria bacterium]|nr:sigma-54-dependent Fis family transcriptional regulator [Candidatus Latescibacterota bacterium]
MKFPHRDLVSTTSHPPLLSDLTSEMEFLRHSSAKLGVGDPDQVARRLVQAIVDRGTFDRAGVFLVDEEKEVLRGTWGVDPQGELADISGTLLPIQGALLVQLAGAASIIAGDLGHVLMGDQTGAGPGHLGGNAAASLAVPIRLGHRIVGVLAVDNHTSRRPIHQDQVLPLMVLANQAALAMENNHLRQELRAAAAENRKLRESPAPPGRDTRPAPARPTDLFDRVVARSPGMRWVVELARLAATTDYPVLILGESGTGKDLLAHAIHAGSLRRNHPLVVVNSAALSSGLEDSELFGHVKGAFTSATRDHAGLITAANRGTLFLDEIADLSASSQAKLLRTLENGEVRRVGDSHVSRVDVRLIAATNRDLQGAVEQGGFRDDLYYRLALITITIPPLRDRPEDIPELATTFLEEVACETGREGFAITDEALDLVVRASWPGNARQLKSCLRLSALFAGEGPIRVEHLPETLQQPAVAKPTDPSLPLAEVERRHILRVLEDCGYDRRQAERRLQISRATLQRRLKEYGINP